MKITEKTSMIGIFNGTINDLLKPFENSNQLEWAKRLAPIYIKFGRLFRLRADLAFAQMCHETGLLKFTGIAKPDWHNFCGLGVTGPGAVQKFLTDDFGVVAHYAHLAWYYYPDHINSMCSKKFDPRHFGDIEKPHPKYNGDTTLGRLNGSWAVPGKTYAKKIAYYANIINGNKDKPEPESEPKPEPIREPIREPKPAPKSYFDYSKLIANRISSIKPKSTIYDIIVQMGHVGRKKGATGAPGERDWTEKLGKAMKPLLKKSGLKFRIMGADNWLKKKPNKAKIFFSLHYDGSTNKNARGFSCGYPVGTNQRFKDAMAMSYKQFTEFNQRPDNYTKGLRNYYAWTLTGRRKIQHVEANYYCLLEHFFGTNDIEHEWGFANIDKIAKHHVNLIVKFLKEN